MTGLGRAGVEIGGLVLHPRGFLADTVERQGFDEPYRSAGVEARDMFAADERDHASEPVLERFDETPAVFILLRSHSVEDRGGRWVLSAQTLRIGGIDAPVILLGGDGEREDLRFRQVGEAAAAGKAGIMAGPSV